MNAGTRTTRGVIWPPRPVSSASDCAGTSSPAPPSCSSGDVAGAVSGGVVASVSGVSGTVGVSLAVGVVAAGGVTVSSSSPPQPASASASAAAHVAQRRANGVTVVRRYVRAAMDTR